MPVKRNYSSLPVRLSDGGRLLSDLPQGTVGPANFDEKINFVSEIAEVRKRAGWDYPAPMGDWAAEMLYAFGVPVEQIRGVRRPNGTYAVVGCGGGYIKVFNYDTDAWETIGSGYGQPGDVGFRFWSIEDIAGYVVFNNSRDLPAIWQIGNAAVTPVYEIREAGYASVGHIVEYVDGVLMCADVVEISDSAQSLVMNSLDPYGLVPSGLSNYLLWTEVFSNAVWTPVAVTVTDGEDAPNGLATADAVLETAVSSGHRIFQTIGSPALDGSTPYVFSVYVGKSTTRSKLRLSISSVGAQVNADFDLVALSAVATIASGFVAATADIEAVGTFGGVDWFRVSVSGTTPPGGLAFCNAIIQFKDGSGALSYLGVITEGFNLWGAAFQAGSEASTYFVNVGAQISDFTTRISFERIWSNIGAPGDFAITVDGSIAALNSTVTLSWPMASFAVGDEIIIVGAGTSGGNLQTTIQSINPGGKSWVLDDNAITTVVNAIVSRPTDINSIAGFDRIEDDGSAIILQIPLKTQLMVFKASGHIWQSYYTGNLDEPFAKDRVTKKAGIAPRFPRAVVNVVTDNNEEYLLFPGAMHFYRFDLGSQAPQQERNFQGAEEELFFSRVKGADRYGVWAADNTCTDEIIFAYPWNDYEEGVYAEYGASRAVALKYAKGAESISEISGFGFSCAAHIQKPLGGFTCDEQESWFLMGSGDSTVTLYGETNFEVLTLRRYGELFEASLSGGLFAPNQASNQGTYLRRFGLDMSDPAGSHGTDVTIYSAMMPNSPLEFLETRRMTDPEYPGSIGLYYRKPYYKYRLVSSSDEDLRIQGFLWTVSQADTQAIDRIT